MAEYKLYGNEAQYRLIDEAIRTAQFIRNKALRLWMDAKDTEESVGKYDLSKLCAELAKAFDFAAKLNSMARQASAERAWAAISRFYNNVQEGIKPVGFPKFKKDSRSVEYKTSGWKLSDDRKRILFTDGHGIGSLKMKGTRDLLHYDPKLIKRVRIIRRADGYYVQFCLKVDRQERLEPTGTALGLDVGLKEFYTDSSGKTEENPKFLRKAEESLKRLQRRVSRKNKGSKNRKKARARLAKKHLKVSRQRKDHAIDRARCVMKSNDLVAYEDLKIRNMVKNRSLAKSINDASWYGFRLWLEYFAKVFGRQAVAVPAAYTSQDCSGCGNRVQKSLSTRTHACPRCKLVMDRDHNAAKNILNKALSCTAGHAGTGGDSSLAASSNAWGVSIRPAVQAVDAEPRIPSL